MVRAQLMPAAMSLLAGRSPGQELSREYEVRGVVVEAGSGLPLEDVEVSLDPSGRPESNVTIDVQPGFEVPGKVSLEGGELPPGMRVGVKPPGGFYSPVSPPTPISSDGTLYTSRRATRSGVDGAFEFPTVPPGENRLFAVPEF